MSFLDLTLNNKQARHARGLVLGLCIVSVLCIFQPFSLTLFSFGCIGGVIGGLVFNIMPFLRTGASLRKILSGLATVGTILLVLVMIASLTAFAYVIYLESLR